jgi:hypothetical protein
MYVRAKAEDGYTMLAVVGAIALVTALVGVALAATNADLGSIRRDADDKQAYAAAQAGISDYSFHLNNDTGYWARCTGVPMPHAVNPDGAAPPNDVIRPIPGGPTDGPKYKIELIPASGQSACSTSDPAGSMLEQSGTNVGTFRIRSTGYAGPDRNGDNRGDVRQSIVATYKQASFLDYVYFTQLETSDPVTYGYANPSPQLTGANSQCTKFRREGREDDPIPNTWNPQTRDWDYCDRIVFVGNDEIDGPLHTNDDLAICGSPDFGRTTADVIEVSAPPQGWINGGCQGQGANPNFIGTFTTNAPILTPPPTNTELRNIAGPTYTYTGQTQIELSGNQMEINNGPDVSIPTSGVIYVQNGANCTSNYSPFNVNYPPSSGCGNAVVHSSGTYTSQLTIAAENDVIVDGSIRRSGNGLVGLIANNFVRIKHPCDDGDNEPGSLQDPRIDAAILAIDHSFIVDNYNCGDDLGELEVNGAIAQKFRGAVGIVGSGGGASHGYTKDYNYDDRLRYLTPPFFLDPVQSAWRVQRETIDFTP